MLFLARFILKGHSQAALVAATLAVLGLLVPPVTWLSSAAIVLVTLVHGAQRGLITAALALLGSLLFTVLIFDTPVVAFMFVLLAWLPGWLIAALLRQTVSLAYSLQVLTVVSIVGVLLTYSLIPDFGELWREPLDLIVEEVARQSPELELAELKQTEQWVIDFLPGLFAMSIMFGTLVSLFIGRWWQAVFYNPGGFANEFQGLDLGRVSALIAIFIMLIAVMLNNVTMMAVATIVFLLYGIQALSILHAVIRIKQVGFFWLAMFYIFMFFIPQFALVMILASLADPWLNIRQRVGQQT